MLILNKILVTIRILVFFTLFTAGESRQKHKILKRPAYAQCPPELNHLSGVYPFLYELCSPKYTYCSEGTVITGICPDNLFFNPEFLDCDNIANIEKCSKKYANVTRKVSKSRSFQDEPSLNDCSRRPCNFYPNADDETGSTYVFCNDGATIIRNCTTGYVFDVKTSDCQLKELAEIWKVPELGYGNLEEDNPLLALNDLNSNAASFQGNPPTSVMGLEPGNGVYIMQDPTPKKGKTPPLDASWSNYEVCPNGTYVTKITKEGCTCSLPQGSYRSGDGNEAGNSTRKRRQVAENAPEVHFFRHPAGINLSTVDCGMKNEGAINGVAVNNDSVEFLCSNSKNVTKDAEFCPITKAVCGISFQLVQKTNKINNVRIRCCPVRSPLFKPEEELAFIYSFDNTDHDNWRKFQFETGVYGVTISPEDRQLEAFYSSLGFTFEMLLNDLEKSLREKTDCLKTNTCIYSWPTFEFKCKDMIRIVKKLIIPPRSRTKLYLAYAQAGYFKIYTNKFIEIVEDIGSGAKYEEPVSVIDGDLELPEAKRNKRAAPENKEATPLKARDMSGIKESQPPKLCPFHNLPASKTIELEPPRTAIISSPVVHNLGLWGNWQNCSSDTYVSRFRQVTHDVKNKDGKRIDKVGVVQLGLGCTKLQRSGDRDIQELDFVNPGFTKKRWKGDSWKGGICDHGVHVGFQMKTGSKSANDMIGTMEMRMICSCDKTDLDNASEGEDDGATKSKRSKRKHRSKSNATSKIMPKTDGWTQEQVCEPLQALQGLVPQEHELKTEMSKYDNHGLINIKMKCVDIPNPGQNCQPNQKRVLLSRCENKDSVRQGCIYSAKIGVGYDLNSETTNLANVLESVGYTLGCVTLKLRQNFQTKFPESPIYREPIWQPPTAVDGLIQTQPNAQTDIYQIVGDCGPYKIRTNRFIKLTNGSNEEEFDLPLPAMETREPCWRDFIEMIPFNLRDKKNFTQGDVLKFHDEYTMDNFTTTVGGLILTSPQVTNFGTWEIQRGWKQCPPGAYIAAIAANRYQASETDHLGITQIGFSCVNVTTGKEVEVLAMKTPGLPGQNKDSLSKWFNCSTKGSVAYGFQLYSQPTQWVGVDDVAANGALLVCSNGEVALARFDGGNQAEEDGHEHSGLWSDAQTCRPKQALCGFIGQFQKFENPYSSEDDVVDNTGLNNLQGKCCNVDHPASTCEPVVRRVLVGLCDNSNGTVEHPCRVKLDVGVSYSLESTGTAKRNFHESIGFTSECAGKILAGTFQKGVKCKAERQICELEWNSVPLQTWYAEDTFKDYVTIPAAKKTPIYQIQGRCDDFVVKTSRYVANDLVREITLTDDDIRKGTQCWEDNIPIHAHLPDGVSKLRVEPKPRSKELRDPEKPEYDFVDDGVVLYSPVLNTTFPDETDEDNWQYCNKVTKDGYWYADSVYVERQGSSNDQAGLVAIALHCRNPKLTGDGDHVISERTPGAVILDEGVWDWKRCECGAGVGFQISSVPAQQLGDDLGIESFKLFCSCAPPVSKKSDEFPKDLQEDKGTWTKEQLCRPRQAICGLQTRSKPFKVVENLLTWDNIGITQAKVKCCDVPNPAEFCQPKQVLREVGTCENGNEEMKRRCIIDTIVGVTYDHDDLAKKNLANFYESIGWGLDCVIPELERNFKENMDPKTSQYEGTKYSWEQANTQQIWHLGSRIQDIIDIKDRTRTLIYQIVGECGPYLVATDSFIREDTNLRNEANVMEDTYRYKKTVRHPPAAPCWTNHRSRFPARDYMDISGKFNCHEYPFHRFSSPGKFTLSNLTSNGLEIEYPAATKKKLNSLVRAREECSEGSYLMGYATEKRKLEGDDLGTVHYLAKCKKLSSVSQAKHVHGYDSESKRAKARNNTNEEEEKKSEKDELLLKHPSESFDKQHLMTSFQKCIDGVLVGFQVQTNGKPDTDDTGVEDIRMMCSVGKALEPLVKPKNDWDDAVESCRPYQALCAVSAKFGPTSVGNWSVIDGIGISQVRMACCDVPSPALESHPFHPKEVQRLAIVCNNLQYENDRDCEMELDIGVTYDMEENLEQSKMHLSIGYSMPCVISDLIDTFRETRKVECPIGKISCFDWKRHLNSKIFQHGLTSYKNATRVKAFTRLDWYQTTAKLNNLLILSNEFELVISDKRGEIDRQKFTIPLESFPELNEKPYCDHSDKDRKSPKTSESGKLIPDNLISPMKIEGRNFSQMNVWSPSESFKFIDDTDVLTTKPPNTLVRDGEQGIGKNEQPPWDEWVNCPQGTFLSVVHSENKGKKLFRFKCVNPVNGELYDEEGAGKSPGWKLNKSNEKLPKGTVKPNGSVETCNCPEMPFSLVIGAKTTRNQKSGALVAMKLLCPCDKIGLTNGTTEDGKVTEYMVCKDRQALCGFRVQRSQKDGIASRFQGACCDLWSPLNECDPREALHRLVICDNSYFDQERNCSFDVDVGVTYDFENFHEQVKLYEAMNWNLDCMAQALADKFAIALGSSQDTGKDWSKDAKKSPLGQEWDRIQTGLHEIPVKPWTKLEIFQVVGQCDMYKTYTDRFLITESVTETGAIKNTPKDLSKKDNGPPLNGSLKRTPPECWLDKKPSKGSSILVNSLKPPFWDGGYHEFDASDRGNKLYTLGDSSSRTGFRLAANNQSKISDDNFYDDEDLVGLVLCQDDTYIRKFTGNGIHFWCTAPNYTTPNIRSLKISGVPVGHKFEQGTPAAFIGMTKDSNETSMTLIQSVPQKSKRDDHGNLPALYCHPGQAICGIQGGKNTGAICCTVENPASMCEPKERTMLTAVCDNRKDSRKRKCEMKIGVGVTYNFEEHPISSYFYTSVGYIPECLQTLKSKFQNMSCVSQGNCEYNWGSAPPNVWNKMKAATLIIDMEPYQKIEYYQKVGTCTYPEGEIIIPVPFLEGKVFNSADKQIKTFEMLLTRSDSATGGKKVDECKLKFMDLSEKPPPPPIQDHAPIKPKNKFPLDIEALPFSSFHGTQESDNYEYFSEDFAKDNSIVLTGPIDLDLELNLKPKWRNWSNCQPDSYVAQMEIYISTVTRGKDNKTKVDALGVNQMLLSCVNKKWQNTNDLELFTEKGMVLPEDKDRIYRPCQEGCVAIGLEVQLRSYQGPLKDDNAYVNFKQLCSCGNHAVNDFTKVVTPRDHYTGSWETPQVCPPRYAVCGYASQFGDFEQVAESDLQKTSDAFLLYDNLGITGLKAKCCFVPSPVNTCEPVEAKILIAECDNTDIKKGNRVCQIEIDVGLSYIYHVHGARMSDYYESLGWNLECSRDELIEKFKASIGISEYAKELDWSSTKPGNVWNRAVNGTLEIPMVPKAKYKVYQIIGTCGMYRVYSNVFIWANNLNESESKTILLKIGSPSPDRCWADVSPIKARNWISQVRYQLVPNFDAYVRIKDDKMILWEAEDKSGRKGCRVQTPDPPLPAFRWEDPHLCPVNSYIRSFSVRRAINMNAEYMPKDIDVYGVVMVAYHCMYPNMTVAEEKVYSSKIFERGLEERRRENKRSEKHDAPGGRYQYCLGAAMGVEIESIPASKALVDNYGILDVRFMCKTIGKDSDFAHKVDLIGIDINPPTVYGNAVCKAKQALCSFQGAFSKGIDRTEDNYAMSNIKVGCCNVPSPLETGIPETKFLLATTCDNLVYNRPRKCQYVLGVGIQYDVKNHKEATYFYLSVGYTPTCLAEEIKTKFPELLKSPPQVFQEMAPMKLAITVEARTRVDIYQLVGQLNAVRVHSNVIQKVALDKKLRELDRANSTEKSKLPEMVEKECEVDGLDMDMNPSAHDVDKPTKIDNLEMPKTAVKECKFKEGVNTAVYKLSADNAYIIEGVRDLNIEINHETTWRDYDWANCSDDALVTGYDSKSGDITVAYDGENRLDSDKFGIGAMAVQCEGINDKSSGKKVLYHAQSGSNFGKTDFISNDSSQLKDGSFCKEGVAIGFSHQVQPWRKSNDDEGMIDFQLYCSCGDVVWKSSKDEKDKKKDKPYSWTDPRFCKPREAICGFTIQAQKLATGSLRKHDNIAVTNLRAKCCAIESPVQQCVPAEKLALVGECDNSNGVIRKACKVDLYVGLTYNYNKLENARPIRIYEGLGWNLPCVKDALAESFAQSIKSAKLYTWKEKKTAKCWNKLQKISHPLTAQPGTKMKMFQVIGSCGFYKVFTGKFVERQEDAHGVISSVNEHDLDNEIGVDEWDPPCWESSTPIRGRDFLMSKISPSTTCPQRSSSRFQCTMEEKLLQKETEGSVVRKGYVVTTPHPALPHHIWGGWKFCPMGTYIRGWASVAAGMASKKERKKDDYSGVVFVKAICQGPDGTRSRETEVTFLQTENEWDEPSWVKKGKYGTLYCVGAGIGIQGVIRATKATHSHEKSSLEQDIWYFHDTKLICSCGNDAGFLREGLKPVDDKQTRRDDMAKEQPLEACRPGYALCGLRVSWGMINIGDIKKQDGYGISNMQATCCEVPSPASRCANSTEKVTIATYCDNSQGTVPRRCMFNLAVGIAYNYEDYETESLFYDSNGFTTSCIAADVQKMFKESKPKACSEKGCKYKWDDAPSRIWQGSGTVSQTQEVRPKQRLTIYQVVGECSSGISVLTNQFVKVVTDTIEKEVVRETWVLDELPAMDKTKCDMQ